ncbi:hypothetical protein [Halobiforma nitratireducens]|uniref:Putative membrane-bound metal-dependent hydrolase n=1 Tax=Halobiforma nitratireducens JCM 10879 TaxID=1227454 RepID=M0M3H2_9EURY|nr:hypothetical protein [Halobiforma nitratireducens]EMA39154.1 putative membrane-bound metal-dependent hydrolase [Halobiforma nitratireducens JCM 10879]
MLALLHLLFPTHLAMGYLIAVYSRYPVAYLVLGSAMPDLLDRSLYWLGLTPFTHTVGHSLAVALPVALALAWLFGTRGVAFAVGWLVHIVTDFLNVLTTRGFSETAYYVLFLSPPPSDEVTFATVTVGVPTTEITHTVHPVILALEVGVLCWASVVLLRDLSVSRQGRASDE